MYGCPDINGVTADILDALKFIMMCIVVQKMDS